MKMDVSLLLRMLAQRVDRLDLDSDELDRLGLGDAEEPLSVIRRALADLMVSTLAPSGCHGEGVLIVAGPPPVSGTRLSDPLRSGALRANVWYPGTYLLYQRGIEYFQPAEEPRWLDPAIKDCEDRLGPLSCYRDEATQELVPVLVITQMVQG